MPETQPCAQRRSLTKGRLLLILLPAIYLTPALYFGAYLLLRPPLPDRVEIIAHRGNTTHAPENTLAAFRAAARSGADRLELDVRMSKDGIPVVIHDAKVDRTTDGKGSVSSLPLAALRKLDAGNGQRIPTFAEAATFAKRENLPLLVDIKASRKYPGLEQKIIDVLVKTGTLDRAVLQSFSPRILNRLHALAPSATLCRLYNTELLNTDGPQAGGARCVGFPATGVLLFPWVVRRHKAAGDRVWVWTKGASSLTLRILQALGVDGMIVDDPASARHTVLPSAQM